LVDLVNYPETVAFAGVIISPFWRRFIQQDPLDRYLHRAQLFEEIRRTTGIADFEFSSGVDPLVQHLEEAATRALWASSSGGRRQ